jgi:acyl-CoA synthetase (NDP forming)
MVAATLPELLDDDAAWRFAEAGVPAIAGLRTGVAVAAALAAPPADPARIRSLLSARRRGGRWLAEHEAKALLRSRGVPVPRGLLALNEDEAVAAFHELSAPVALKLSAAGLRHKTAIGAIALDLRDETGVREAFRRLGVVYRRISTVVNPTPPGPSLNAQFDPQILVEETIAPGLELLVAVRTDAVVHALVIGLGGVHVEALDRVAILPLPADEPRIAEALESLGAAAAAKVVAAIAAAAEGLALLECNPVIVHPDGAVVVDAIAQEVAP